jgi:hypothetical protein
MFPSLLTPNDFLNLPVGPGCGEKVRAMTLVQILSLLEEKCKVAVYKVTAQKWIGFLSTGNESKKNSICLCIEKNKILGSVFLGPSHALGVSAFLHPLLKPAPPRPPPILRALLPYFTLLYLNKSSTLLPPKRTKYQGTNLTKKKVRFVH